MFDLYEKTTLNRQTFDTTAQEWTEINSESIFILIKIQWFVNISTHSCRMCAISNIKSFIKIHRIPVYYCKVEASWANRDAIKSERTVRKLLVCIILRRVHTWSHPTYTREDKLYNKMLKTIEDGWDVIFNKYTKMFSWQDGSMIYK